MSHEQKRIQYLKDKFNMPDGLIVNGLPKPAPKQTVESAGLEKARQDLALNNLKLATGQVRVNDEQTKQSKLVRLYAFVSK